MLRRGNDWCEKHAREKTGFTTLFCPECDKEVAAPTDRLRLPYRDHMKRIWPTPSLQRRRLQEHGLVGEILSVTTALDSNGSITSQLEVKITKNRYGHVGNVVIVRLPYTEELAHLHESYRRNPCVPSFYACTPSHAGIVPPSIQLQPGDPWIIV